MWVRERGRKFTCVTLDDHPANGQSKSHATSFRRDEGVEYVAGKFTGEITASSDRSVVNLASGPQHHGDFPLGKMSFRTALGRLLSPPLCREYSEKSGATSCPLWLISRHFASAAYVRFTPESGHSLVPSANIAHRPVSGRKR